MSIFDMCKATCPQCGSTFEANLVVSVNAMRRPDLRAQIIERSFQAVACPNCATQMRLPPELLYLDVQRGRWIAAHPVERLDDWQQVEATARTVFDSSFGANAPGSTRELFSDVVPRIVFGWPALREKLVCDDLEVQDTVLELLKLEIMRHAAGAPYSDSIDLRLIGGDCEMLSFAWIDGADESIRASASVPRQAYDDLLADLGPYAALSAGIGEQFFVDLRRLLAPGTPPATNGPAAV